MMDATAGRADRLAELAALAAASPREGNDKSTGGLAPHWRRGRTTGIDPSIPHGPGTEADVRRRAASCWRGLPGRVTGRAGRYVHGALRGFPTVSVAHHLNGSHIYESSISFEEPLPRHCAE